MNFDDIRCPWGDTLKTCAITVCDLDGVVLYQNKRSIEVNGDVRNKSMIPCHSERSRQIINRLITNGENNAYTIEKRGIRKLIYQILEISRLLLIARNQGCGQACCCNHFS